MSDARELQIPVGGTRGPESVKVRTRPMSILCIEGSDVKHLSSYLARFSAFLEDREFIGTVLSWEKVASRGSYRYLGHNLPSEGVIQFYNLSRDLNTNERGILDYLLSNRFVKPLKDSRSSQTKYKLVKAFYIIGHLNGDRSTKAHEISHALYRLNSTYKTLIAEMYSCMSEKALKKIHECLTRRGYPAELFEDEFGAYLLEQDSELIKLSKKDLPSKFMNDLQSAFDDAGKSVTVIQ